jgi:outer membrane protein
MKKITLSLFIALATIGFNNNINAQKIAHLRVDSLLTLMPEAKKAETLAQDFLKQFEKEIASMNTEFQTKYGDYMANQATYSDLIRKNKEEELQMLQQRIEAFKEQAQQEYQNKNAELSKPIYDKAKKAIDAVAKENGYKYVLDTSSGVVLYSEPTEDILQLVKKKLDTMPEVSLPGAAKETAPTQTPKKPGTK